MWPEYMTEALVAVIIHHSKSKSAEDGWHFYNAENLGKRGGRNIRQ